MEDSRAALQSSLPGHRRRSSSLENLAVSRRDRFQQQGVLSDLDEAIELHRAALALRPPGHPRRSLSLNNLANSLRAKFEQQGVLSDLDEAIEIHRAALQLCPPGHSDRSIFLNNLGISLQGRFQQRGVLSDLDEAIELHRTALLHPYDNSDRSSLGRRFQQRGALSDLDEAIELHRAALELRPPGHSSRTSSLNNLAINLRDRFQQRGTPSDLDEAIELHRAALELCPPGHSLRTSSLNNLAISLRDRFQQRGVSSNLDEAIELHRAALELCPPDHSDRSMSLDNLAISLRDRFQQRGIPSDLDEAIELHRAALLLHPSGHSNRSRSLNNVAQRGVFSDLDEAIELHRTALKLRPPGHSLRASLRDRFQRLGVSSDLDEAIELHRAALELCPLGHSLRTSSLSHLAISLQDRYQQRGILSDLDEAFRFYLQLSHLSHGASRSDLSAAKSWAASAEKLKHDSALVAYQTTLKFLDQHISLLPLHSLAMDACSCSVRHGALTTAVELLEQGCAVFWTQLSRFRTPLDELSASGDTGAALAEEFKRLSFRLPEDGPVIIVNASQYGCDALIILSAQAPVHVPLDISRTEVSELSSEFHSLAGGFGSSSDPSDLVSILRNLWDCIVDPVVQALRESKVKRGSRIWWCPTAEFTLLPIHAAGPYERKRDNLSQIYISSYTPTLATLIRARQQVSQDASPQHFVAIGQAKPDRGKELLYVAPELAVVAQHVAPIVSFTTIEDNDATVQGAVDALSQNQWLHLACHGILNRQRPFESSFAMRDGPLTINDIIRSDWQNLEFAFLSACHTTVGDEKSSDESIHLAAALQFSGFRSLIGPMWSVDDEVVLQIVSAFYSNLVDDSGRLDCTRAAFALHKAVKSLRKKIPLEQQIVFIHIGV
ncbi:CHAT domain-containing protein [Suillus ampliporus]|nr:CHAT domain-containing protein [Suillus ampliporus]